MEAVENPPPTGRAPTLLQSDYWRRNSNNYYPHTSSSSSGNNNSNTCTTPRRWLRLPLQRPRRRRRTSTSSGTSWRPKQRWPLLRLRPPPPQTITAEAHFIGGTLTQEKAEGTLPLVGSTAPPPPFRLRRHSRALAPPQPPSPRPQVCQTRTGFCERDTSRKNPPPQRRLLKHRRLRPRLGTDGYLPLLPRPRHHPLLPRPTSPTTVPPPAAPSCPPTARRRETGAED